MRQMGLLLRLLPDARAAVEWLNREVQSVNRTAERVGFKSVVRRLLPCVIVGSLLAGCGATGQPSGSAGGSGAIEDGNRDPNAVSPLGKTRGEPNDSFEDAIVAVYAGRGVARLQGSISVYGDFDVFNLGPMEPGDAVRVSADAVDSAVDICIALYDDQERLFVMDDDSGGDYNAFVEQPVRHEGDPYYLVVYASPYAMGSESSVGAYEVMVNVTRGGDVPAPEGQVLYLGFDGAVLEVPSIPVTQVPAFRAGDISPVYAGQTESMKAGIIATVQENFEGLNVAIVTSDDESLPDGPMSCVYFGGSSNIAYGISEAVDTYNSDPDDVAVIFTESFRPRLFTRTPTMEEMAIAIGNIASHEAGHLLGLHHVTDAEDLMDEANPADTFLADQEFKESELSSNIAPLGTQDALLLLAEILGLL